MTHQIKRIVNLVKLNKSQRKSTGIIFLDVEKAFDTVWHNGLVYKLKNYGYPMHIQKIVKSFLDNRKFVVEINATHSTGLSFVTDSIFHIYIGLQITKRLWPYTLMTQL